LAPMNRPLLMGGAVIVAYAVTYFACTFFAGVEEASDVARLLRLSRKRS
jgi:hypothetical protein